MIKLRVDKKVVLAVLVITFLTAILRWQSWTLPLDRDEGAYAYIASHLFQSGFVPYRDAWDHKPPGIYVLYWSVFQIVGTSEFALRFLGFINSIIGSILIYKLVKKINSDEKITRILVLGYLFLSNSFVLAGLQSNTEVFMTTFLNAGLLISWPLINKFQISYKRLVAIGVIFGISILIKPVAAFSIGVFLLWIILKKDIRSSLVILFSMVIPVLICVFLFVSSGTLNYFYQAVILFNRAYAARGYSQINSIQGFISWLTSIPDIVILLSLGGILLIVLSRKFLKDQKLLFLILWMVSFLIAGKSLSSNVTHYYFPFISGFILFLSGVPKVRLSKEIVVLSLGVCILIWSRFLILPPKVAFLGSLGSDLQIQYDARDLGSDIKNNSKDNDTILMLVDEPEVLFYASRFSPIRYVNSFSHYSDYKSQVIKGINDKPISIIAYENWIAGDIHDLIIKEGYKPILHPFLKNSPFITIYWRGIF